MLSRRRSRLVMVALGGMLLLSFTACTENAPSTPHAQQRQALDGGTFECFDAGCGDTQIDPANCGSCGSPCSLAQSTARCVAGRCEVASCTAGHADLDGLAGNGCEVDCPGADGGVDTCDGVDNDCNGAIDDGFATGSDLNHCGVCGVQCGAGFPNALFSCNGTCQFLGCKPGFSDLGNQQCDAPCVFTSAQESCNGLDDDCDGQVDEDVITPSPVAVCGVSPLATRPECTAGAGGVTVSCMGGAWRCTFQTARVCSPTCASAAEVCDGVDNNCNGQLNENMPNFGEPCASDVGLPPPGHGVCRTTGAFVCSSDTAVKCSAVKDLTQAGPELCDGLDNDCDGLIDEPFSSKGSNTTYFVKPAVTKVGTSLWVYSYEASRAAATATNVTAGQGNGYSCSGAGCGTLPVTPAGVTLDSTVACSKPNVFPWSNVTPIEAEQTCSRAGGHLCTTAEWQTACRTNPPSGTNCFWGYNPRGVACTSLSTATKFCNLGSSFDFDPVTLGDQDGLLVTGSPALQNCFADWTGMLGNSSLTAKIFDLTGNLRELTKSAASSYATMGGGYSTQVQQSATCSGSGLTFDQNFASPEAGFRCCFSADPTL